MLWNNPDKAAYQKKKHLAFYSIAYKTYNEHTAPKSVQLKYLFLFN